jgi:hypothetical protein
VTASAPTCRVSRCRFPNLCAARPDIVKFRVNRAGCGLHREGEEPQCAGTFNAISAIADWQFAPKWDLYTGLIFSKVNGGLANGYIERNNIDPNVGLRFRF